MSDLLIKNLELPKKDRIQLSVYPDGKVINHSSFTDTTSSSVVLPPHGRLIDVDELLNWKNITCVDTGWWETDYDCVKKKIILKAPTILEASEER